MRRPNLGEIPQQGVCPYLVNNMNRPCPNRRHCRFSHDRQDILEWQQTKGRLMCSSGSTCRYLRSRTCMFTHPPQDRDPAKMDRSEQMSLDLSYKEKVVVGVLNGNTKFVGITNDREISSFNNISSTEIAVPGQFSVLLTLSLGLTQSPNRHAPFLYTPNYTVQITFGQGEPFSATQQLAV